MDNQDKKQSQNKERRFWRSPKAKWSGRVRLLGIPLGGFVMLLLGVGALASFHGVMDYTNSNGFCYGCHIGMDTVVEEYEQSVHFKNASGVQATCADCHVPKAFFGKMKTKIIATKDIYHKLVGTVNLENFESLRLEQAEYVWEILRETDSATCRSCHTPEKWDTQWQSARARVNHAPDRWAKRGETCIDCHYGIAHKRPSLAKGN